MIGYSSDRDSSPADVLDDSADVGAAFGAEVFIEVREPIFCAEDQVREESGESVAHATRLQRFVFS